VFDDRVSLPAADLHHHPRPRLDAADLFHQPAGDPTVAILVDVFHGSLPGAGPSTAGGNSSSDNWPISSSSV
jgi:hypothetical protein